MDKFLKIHYQLENKLFRWKVEPNKSALIDWTYRTCWNSGEEPLEGFGGKGQLQNLSGVIFTRFGHFIFF